MTKMDDVFFDEEEASFFQRIKIFLYIFIIFLIAVIAFEMHMRHKKEKELDSKSSFVEKKGEIFLWALGASETYGVGASSVFSWPNQLPQFFETSYPGIALKVQNSGIMSANSSEGMNVIHAYLDGVNPKSGLHGNPRPDFALITFGMNNIWNLHSGTYLDLDEGILEDEGFKRAIKKMDVESLKELVTIPGKVYNENLKSEGWNGFFNDFNNPYLRMWIEKDILEMISLLKSKDVKPVLLTYFLDTFPELNEFIKEIAQKAQVPVLDLQTSSSFFKENNMLLGKEGTFQLNSSGYNFVAKMVNEKFSQKFSQQEIEDILAAKEK